MSNERLSISTNLDYIETYNANLTLYHNLVQKSCAKTRCANAKVHWNDKEICTQHDICIQSHGTI